MFNLFKRRKSNESRYSKRTQFDAVIVSYGGVGTTFFVEFLDDRLSVNSLNSYDDGIKSKVGALLMLEQGEQSV